MKYSVLGLIAGLLLVIAATTGGFVGLLSAVILGAVGAALGAHLDGDVDLTSLMRGRRE